MIFMIISASIYLLNFVLLRTWTQRVKIRVELLSEHMWEVKTMTLGKPNHHFPNHTCVNSFEASCPIKVWLPISDCQIMSDIPTRMA